MEQMNIWEFNNRLTSRLLNINLANIEIGRRLIKSKRPFLRGIGTQALAWGVINIGIAIIGGNSTRRRLDALDDPFDKQTIQQEKRKLRRILMINTPLNLLYVWGGSRLARHGKSATARANGLGVILQGLILFGFDTFHLNEVSKLEQ